MDAIVSSTGRASMDRSMFRAPSGDDGCGGDFEGELFLSPSPLVLASPL